MWLVLLLIPVFWYLSVLVYSVVDDGNSVSYVIVVHCQCCWWKAEGWYCSYLGSVSSLFCCYSEVLFILLYLMIYIHCIRDDILFWWLYSIHCLFIVATWWYVEVTCDGICEGQCIVEQLRWCPSCLITIHSLLFKFICSVMMYFLIPNTFFILILFIWCYLEHVAVPSDPIVTLMTVILPRLALIFVTVSDLIVESWPSILCYSDVILLYRIFPHLLMTTTLFYSFDDGRNCAFAVMPFSIIYIDDCSSLTDYCICLFIIMFHCTILVTVMIPLLFGIIRDYYITFIGWAAGDFIIYDDNLIQWLIFSQWLLCYSPSVSVWRLNDWLSMTIEALLCITIVSNVSNVYLLCNILSIVMCVWLCAFTISWPGWPQCKYGLADYFSAACRIGIHCVSVFIIIHCWKHDVYCVCSVLVLLYSMHWWLFDIIICRLINLPVTITTVTSKPIILTSNYKLFMREKSLTASQCWLATMTQCGWPSFSVMQYDLPWLAGYTCASWYSLAVSSSGPLLNVMQ